MLIERLEQRQFLSAATPADIAPAAQRPNFLFVIMDDHRFDAMGVVQREQGAAARFPWLKTPNMDRLADESVRMRNAFVVDSLCSPSRSSFLTGMYPHETGVVGNEIPFPADSVTYATLLKQAGYTTGYTGKWHMGTQSGARPGFDFSAGFVGQGSYFNNIYEVNGVPEQTNGWVDTVTTDYAIDFLKAQQASPFALAVGFKSPHTPRSAPPSFNQALANAVAAPAVSANSPPPYPGAGGSNLGKEEVRDYFRTVMAADAELGRLLDTLDTLQLAQNTVVVFTSDNGFYIGEHGLTDKRSAYEESMRVPMLVRYPGVTQPGATLDQMVLNIDVAPTFLELAGVPVPNRMQGKSFAPLLSGQPAQWRDRWLYEYYKEEPYKVPTVFAVRTETAKLVKWADHPEWTQLFDLSADPYEMKNLFDQPAAAALRQQMLAEFDEAFAEVGASLVPPVPPQPVELQAAVKSVTLSDSVPTVQRLRASITVRVTNSGTEAFRDQVPISIRLTTGTTPTTAGPEIAQANPNLRLKPGESKTIKVRIRELPAVPEGDYRVGVIVDPDNTIQESNKADNAAADPQLHHVGPPVIDLSGTYVVTPTTLEPGEKQRVTIQIANSGNVPAVGRTFLTITATPAETADPGIALGDFRVKLKLKAGAAKAYTIKFVVPPTVVPGPYELTSVLDSTNALAETDEANNVVITQV